MQGSRSEQEIRDEIRRLGPFHHDIQMPYGLRTYSPDVARRDVEHTRLDNLIRHAWPSLLEGCGGSLEGKRVLDVGCNCGGFSFEAAKSGAAYVLGIDVVDRYLEQADFVRQVLGYEQVEFRKMDVEAVDPGSVGIFDVTLCFGVLYHLENPVLAMKKLASVTDRAMVVDTKVARVPLLRKGAWIMNFPAASTVDSKTATTSLWRSGPRCQFTPNALAVAQLLRFVGFPKVKRIKTQAKTLEKRYRRGQRATFLAVRE